MKWIDAPICEENSKWFDTRGATAAPPSFPRRGVAHDDGAGKLAHPLPGQGAHAVPAKKEQRGPVKTKTAFLHEKSEESRF